MAKRTMRSGVRGRRGAALALALLVFLIMSSIGMALVAGSVQQLRMTRLQRDASLAFNAAESGAERALRHLRDLGAPPAGVAPFDPFGGDQPLGPARYRVTIDPDDTNLSGQTRRYAILSTGVAGSRQEQVELYVQLGSFGRYAYFTDYETSPGGTRIWFRSGDVIDGPAHSNSSGGTDFQISWARGASPIFLDQVTTAGSGIDYSPRPPSTPEEYASIYRDGSRGFRIGVSRIEMPASTTQQRDAAWGATSGFPSRNGVYVGGAVGCVHGGIYIRGDCAMQFSVPGPGQQRIAITQGSTTTTVTIDRIANTTTVVSGGSTRVYAGQTNGVLYCSGEITSLRGTLADSVMNGSELVARNAFTIATDVQNNKDVTITGDLRYQTAPDRTKPWDDPVNLRAAALGVVARDITIATSAPRDLTLHGVMMAGGANTSGGSFSAASYDSRPTGTLTLVGGIIQKYRGPVGTFSSTTLLSGYSKNYTYDARMAVLPPPFFPTTGAYERLSFRRVSAGFAPSP